MLRAVGHGYVVNPDRALRRLAAEEGWTPLVFRRHITVPAGRRFATLRQLTGPVARDRVALGVTAALVVVAAATAWAALAARRRRPRR